MISKRKRFIITAFLLSLGFILVQILDEKYRFFSISALGVATAGLFYWSLWEGLGFNTSLISLILPVFYTLGIGFFWFLLPTSVLARIPVIIIYALGIYALCLTSNIYSVAAIRTIALLRAARGVGFVLTLFTSFLILDTIFSLKVNVYLYSLLVFVASLPLFFQGLWSIELENRLSGSLLGLSIVSALVMSQVSASLFFWPVTVVVGSLFLTGVEYILLGLGQAKLEGRLFSQTVREYLLVGVMVFIGMFIVTHWQ